MFLNKKKAEEQKTTLCGAEKTKYGLNNDSKVFV